MIQLSKADIAFEQSVLRCTLNSSLLTVIPYFGVLRVVHEHCCSCPERKKLGHQQYIPRTTSRFFEEQDNRAFDFVTARRLVATTKTTELKMSDSPEVPVLGEGG